MPVKTQWFKDRLAERRMSQRALARAMKLDSAAVSLMFRGRREMKISEAIEIARLLGRPADEVMEAAGVDLLNRGVSVQMCGLVDGSGEVHNIQNEDRRSVPLPPGDLPNSVHAVQCRTAGTPIDFMDGWLLYVDSVVRPGVPAEAVDRLSVCKLANGGIMYLAKPTRGYGRNRWHLNGPAASAQDVELEWANPFLLIQT
jgi:transcriptional regulator with XRE-family HTH domain